MKTIKAKSILQKVRYDNAQWFGIDYNMNLYKGCCHGCIYCDSRSDCYRIDKFDEVRVKFDALAILNRELRSRRNKGVVGIGAMSDAYNPFERELEITRGALQLIDQYGFGVSIDTKGALVTRDIDVLQRISQQHSAIVKLTVTTTDDALASIIEPGAPSPSRRLAALRELADANLFCGILFTPLLPHITDDREARGTELLKRPTKINPKRMQRTIHRAIERRGVSTKAQQAIRDGYEAGKSDRRKQGREERLLAEERRYEFRRQKRKEKKRGH